VLLAALRDSGPVPGDTNGAIDKKRASDIGVAGEKPKKKKAGESSKAFDMDKLAEGLQKLNEDDLLQVVQMVHDHKSDESWMRNDIEREWLDAQDMVTTRQILTGAQKANSTSTSTPYPNPSSRCSGTSPPRRSRSRVLLSRQTAPALAPRISIDSWHFGIVIRVKAYTAASGALRWGGTKSGTVRHTSNERNDTHD